jgi:hypothetical protein
MCFWFVTFVACPAFLLLRGKESGRSSLQLWVISGFREAPENCAVMGYYAASSDNLLTMFRDNLSVPSSGFQNPLWDLSQKPR